MHTLHFDIGRSELLYYLCRHVHTQHTLHIIVSRLGTYSNYNLHVKTAKGQRQYQEHQLSSKQSPDSATFGGAL